MMVERRNVINIIRNGERKKRGKKSVSFDRTDSEAPSSSFINTSPGNPLNIYMLTFDASGGGGGGGGRCNALASPPPHAVVHDIITSSTSKR